MATDNPERRNRIVMALGIATIVLFSANLLTALAGAGKLHHVLRNPGS